MAWRKAFNNQPAVGTPKLIGTADGGDQRYVDDDGDTVYATSASDFPVPMPQTTFMGIPVQQPSEGSTHALLIKIASDIAAIKSRLQI
jgi:hypothetical protein